MLNTTQLSGPEIDWWLPPGAHDGMIWTPYLTFGKVARSHGPVMIMPSLPELKSVSLRPAFGWKSRYSEWSACICRSKESACTPAGESKATLGPAGFSRWPPASQNMASYCQTVVSLPSEGNVRPKILCAGSVIAFASAASWLQVQPGPGKAR